MVPTACPWIELQPAPACRIKRLGDLLPGHLLRRRTTGGPAPGTRRRTTGEPPPGSPDALKRIRTCQGQNSCCPRSQNAIADGILAPGTARRTFEAEEVERIVLETLDNQLLVSQFCPGSVPGLVRPNVVQHARRYRARTCARRLACATCSLGQERVHVLSTLGRRLPRPRSASGRGSKIIPRTPSTRTRTWKNYPQDAVYKDPQKFSLGSVTK